MPRFEDLPRHSAKLLPAERFRVACDLSDAAIVMVRSRYRREHPELSPEEIDALVDKWLLTRPGAEQGDGLGRLVQWPRSGS